MGSKVGQLIRLVRLIRILRIAKAIEKKEKIEAKHSKKEDFDSFFFETINSFGEMANFDDLQRKSGKTEELNYLNINAFNSKNYLKKKKI